MTDARCYIPPTTQPKVWKKKYVGQVLANKEPSPLPPFTAPPLPPRNTSSNTKQTTHYQPANARVLLRATAIPTLQSVWILCQDVYFLTQVQICQQVSIHLTTSHTFEHIFISFTLASENLSEQYLDTVSL